MPTVDVLIESQISRSVRARQLEAAFDVPAQEKCKLTWQGDLPIDNLDWNIGLLVGPSGCGKSVLLKRLFGDETDLRWGSASVIDDFASHLSIEEITQACQSVGFNTIPAWLRPYHVLSNGEKFRVEIARRLLETPADKIIVIDEFTSVVDRQVAQIASHAVQKFIRRYKRKMVVASCHYDIVDWLQPDWILEPATMTFTRRLLRGRPSLSITITRTPYDTWQIFAPYHYMSAELNRSAACFVLLVNDKPASFAAILHRPHPKSKDIKGISRAVTLPDYQGLGLAYVLMDTLGSAYKALGYRLHMYPAHPSFVRATQKTSNWRMLKAPGVFSAKRGASSSVSGFGGRPCAVFDYVGQKMDTQQARLLVN
jgi:ABC-type lipoprotein export system ATPase subunit